MSSVLIPIIVILVVPFAGAIRMDRARRRVRNVPSSGDDRARRQQSAADHRSARPR